jgi:hypothetical protein
MADFFPLVPGARREYALANSQGTGTFTVEVLAVSTSGDRTVAQCRRTTHWQGVPLRVYLFEVVKDDADVSSDGIPEFLFPVQNGTEWILSPRRYWIEALDAVIETKAGVFKNCLRVAYLIAEGDGGSGERYYAPGVGLVKVVENDEGDPFTHELISHTG